MSWFDEQLRYRKEMDEASFADAIESIAGAIMGKRLSAALSSKEIAHSAIEEILAYYNCRIKNDQLPQQIQSLDDQLEYLMRPFGIMRRRVTLEKGWYNHAIGPMLGTLKEDGSAVALIPGKVYGYSYLNLASGKRVRLNGKTEQLLDDEALCFYQPLPLKSLTMVDLLKFMAEQLSLADIIIYIGMLALSALLGLLSPLFNKWLFGEVLESGSTRVLLALASFMICFSVSSLCLGVFKSLTSSRINIKQDIAIQSAVMSRILSLPASFFKEYSSGELAQRAGYVQSLCSIIINTIGTTGLTSVFSLIYLGQIFAYAPALVVPSMVITLATLAIMLLSTFKQMHFTKEEMLLLSKTSGMTYSMITGIQKIKLAGAEKRMFSRWARHYAEEASLVYNKPILLKLSGTLSLSVSLIGTLILYYCAVKSGVSLANYYAFNAAYAMVSGSFMSLASIAGIIANIKPTLEMAQPILEAEPELSERKDVVTRLSGGIELNHLSFRYADNMPNVIDDLSLKIKPGEYLAIVGSTGCGKSTLMRLILGFEKPQKGSIYYDRKDISRLDLKSLRRNIGVVMQDGKLFLGDIFSNIVISAPHLTLDDAWKAAELAAVADDIRRMPMGMHTLISEGQGGISGGQRQRLLIARAIAPKPKILMFDEATSALDNLTQRAVAKAIDSLNCTRIVVAHRLSTIRHCDRIIVLDKGRIVEDGNYDELIEANGFFADLVARQRLDIEQ